MVSTADALARRPKYEGESWSAARIQQQVGEVRGEQDRALSELTGLKDRAQRVAVELDTEMKKLATLSRELVRRRKLGDDKSAFAWLARVLGRGPIARASVERMLKDQYAVACVRVRESADAADRLREVEAALRADIESLNGRIQSAASNQEKAEAYVRELEGLLAVRRAEEAACLDKQSAAYRAIVASLDQLEGLIAEHKTQAALFASAEERLARLRDSTRTLVGMVNDLYTDIARYVDAASMELDRAAIQIQAVGAAADAAVVLLEMRRSVELLGSSVREASRFVSETQLYFREHLDHLMDELAIFDEQTLRELDGNRREAKALAEVRKELGP